MKPTDLPKKLTPTSIKKLPVLPRRYDVKDHLQRRLYMTVYPSGLKNWHYRYRMKGDRDAKRYIIGEATPDQARKIAEKIAGKVANGISPNAEKAALRKQQQKARESTLRAFIDGRYGEWVISERKSGGATVKAIKSTFDFLLDKPMDSINTWELEKWRKARHAVKITPTTTNRHIAALRACLSKAVAWGVIDIHPLKDLKQSRVDRNQTIRTIDDEQEQRLREALKARDRKMRKKRMSANAWREDRDYATKPDFGKHVDHLEPIVLLALNTGMRRGELLQIKWTDVKTDKIIVRGQTTKSSQTREIPLNKEAKMILKDWRSDSEYVFNNGDNPLTTIKKSWAAIKTAAGLPDLRFHDLRHTFATRVLRRGGDIKTVSALLGHADIATTARYLHATEESMRKAVELL